MDLSSNLGLLGSTTVIAVVVALAVVAAVVSLGVIAEFVVSNRRERVARQESLRTYYQRYALTR